MLHTI